MGLAFVYDEKGEEEEAGSSIPFVYILSMTSFYIRGWLCGDRLDFLVKDCSSRLVRVRQA